jgi:hypothetical protein
MSVSTKISMPVKSFRRIENPFEKEGKKMYLAVILAKNLPQELESWREINPRDPKTTSGVAKKIAESLQNQPECFLFRNRGVTLLSQNVSFNNENNELSIEFSDPTIHGLLDGGHTYAVIRELFDSLTDEEKEDSNLNQAFVKLEILEGFTSKEETTEIVGARNTSMQVKDQSLANLLKHFDSIKEILANEVYAERIAYKETELNDDGSKKDIDIKEILSYLICFDREGFDDKNHPVIAYSGKTAVLKYVENERERLQKYLPLLPQILTLRDDIYGQMPSVWNSNGGKFGRLEGVNTKKGKNVELPFKNVKTEYVIPNSFIYPVLASLRNLVEISDGKCFWKKDPVRFFEEYKSELVQRLGEQALVFRNPNKLGKEKTVWQSCYDYIAMEIMKLRL